MAEVELIGVGAGLGAVLIAALLFFIYLRQSRRAAQRAEERKNAPPPPPLPVSGAPRGDVPAPSVPFEAAPLDSAASPRLVRGGSSPRLKVTMPADAPPPLPPPASAEEIERTQTIAVDRVRASDYAVSASSLALSSLHDAGAADAAPTAQAAPAAPGASGGASDSGRADTSSSKSGRAIRRTKPFWESEPQRSRERRKSGDLSSGLAKPGSPRSPQAAAAAADARQQSSPAAQRVDALLNEIGLGTPPKSPRL